MSMTMTTLRLSLRQGLPLEEVMYHINNTLAERNPYMMFVTLFVVKVDARSRHCEAANAGHCFPICQCSASLSLKLLIIMSLFNGFSAILLLTLTALFLSPF